MDISISEQEFMTAHMNLENSRGKLDASKLSLSSRQSRSSAMSEFERQVKQLEKLVAQYKGMLQQDSTALAQAAAKIQDLDSKTAKYLKSFGATTGASCKNSAAGGGNGSGGSGSRGGSDVSGGGGAR